MVKKPAKHSAKKSMLKKMLKKNGASPMKGLDGGLGKRPLTSPDLMGGSGSNLGTNGIF